MEREALVIVAVSTVAAGYLLARWNADQQSADPTQAPDTTDPASSILDTMRNTVVQAFALWRPPAQYADLIAQAEDQNGLPRDLLARLLYQESRYRPDVINGTTASPVGALGIAQFMPATARELGIDPLDPAQAIPAAARYLKRLYAQVGTWSEALAAYNWGIGNVTRRGLDAAPTETRNYYTQILADVNAADGTAWA